MPRASPTQRLAQALERVAREGGLPPGHGYYPRMPLREPVLEEVEAASGALLGVVTRNRMGCEVLCTDLLFIADVDVPELEDATARGGAPGDGSGASGGGGSRPRPAARQRGGWLPPPPAVGRPGAHPDDAVGRDRRRGCGCRARLAAAGRDERGRVPGVRAGVGVRPPAPGPRGAGLPHRGGAAGHRHGRRGIPRLGPGAGPAHRAGVGPALRRALRDPRQLPGTVDPQAVPRGCSGAAGVVAVRRRRCAQAGTRSGSRSTTGARRGTRSAGWSACRGRNPGPTSQRLVGLHDTRCRVGERLPLA